MCEYETVRNILIKYKSLSCNIDYSNKLDEKLKKQFKNIFKFSNKNINKLILLLRKGVYPCEYMDEWEKFDEASFPEKEEFYCNLNIVDVTDADYMHAKRVSEDFEIKHLGEYHDLFLKSDTLENVIRNLLIGPCKVSFRPRISLASSFKKYRCKISIINSTIHIIEQSK